MRDCFRWYLLPFENGGPWSRELVAYFGEVPPFDVGAYSDSKSLDVQGRLGAGGWPSFST